MLQLLEIHTEPSAFLDLIAHPMLIEDYGSWGVEKRLIEEIGDGLSGSKGATAKSPKNSSPSLPEAPTGSEA